jgi:hypothetical protein
MVLEASARPTRILGPSPWVHHYYHSLARPAAVHLEQLDHTETRTCALEISGAAVIGHGSRGGGERSLGRLVRMTTVFASGLGMADDIGDRRRRGVGLTRRAPGKAAAQRQPSRRATGRGSSTASPQAVFLDGARLIRDDIGRAGALLGSTPISQPSTLLRLGWASPRAERGLGVSVSACWELPEAVSCEAHTSVQYLCRRGGGWIGCPWRG